LTAAGASWCAIDAYFDGITTRGVLLDVAAGRKEGYVTVGQPVTPTELDAVAARAGVKIEPGDVVVVRNGDEAFRRAHPDWVPRVWRTPGVLWSCVDGFGEKHCAAFPGQMMGGRPPSYRASPMSPPLAFPFWGWSLGKTPTRGGLAGGGAGEGRSDFLSPATP